MAEIVYFARCPEHGLHGCRTRCFECGEEVEQVPMVAAETVARVSGVLDEFDALDYRRKRAVSPAELVATIRKALA